MHTPTALLSFKVSSSGRVLDGDGEREMSDIRRSNGSMVCVVCNRSF